MTQPECVTLYTCFCGHVDLISYIISVIYAGKIQKGMVGWPLSGMLFISNFMKICQQTQSYYNKTDIEKYVDKKSQLIMIIHAVMNKSIVWSINIILHSKTHHSDHNFHDLRHCYFSQ
jgi:hypothetical protein